LSRCEIAYGITSRSPDQADPQPVLAVNRGHWTIENSCHYIIDWNYDEDRSRIRIGYGPENITRLRGFAISIIKSKGVRSSKNAATHTECTRRLRLSPHDSKLSHQNRIRLEQIYRGVATGTIFTLSAFSSRSLTFS